MRTKYMEQIILGDLATFKKKGALATEAVNDYVHSVEDKVRQLTAIDIQEHFEKLQELLRKSCLTLDKITLGLGTLVPSPNGNCSRQIENAPRRMITSDSAPWPVWSSSDGSVKTDNERVVNSSSPDIVEGNQEVMVEPSSSSASSTASLSRPPFKARVESIIKQQPQRSSLDDEFAMEIPEPSRTLNADASEFIPSDASVLGPKSSSSKSSNDNIEQSDNPGNLGPENGLKPGARLDLVVGTKPEPPKHLTSSSSTESFLTASATDSEQTKQEEEEEQSLRKEIKKMAGYEINSRSSSGVGARDKEEGLAPNCYPSEAESLPSSLCTKNVIYDTEKVLRGTAQALQRHKASNGLCQESESRPLSHQTKNDLLATGQDSKPAEEVLKERAEGYSLNDDLLDDAQSEWALKQTQGEIPRDVRKTRVPPLWTYVHVSFSDVDVKTGRIYVQMLADELNIQQLPEEINASQSLSKPLRMQDIAVGLIIIAPYDGARYRAKIVSKTSENDIEVFFIDYGNKAKVRLQDLTVANHKKYTKTCKMAIPCVLDDALEVPNLLDDLPDRAYVCLANPFEAEGEIVYRIMDVMSSTRENFREFPDPEPFSAGDDLGTLRVVVTHATSPKSMWLVETKDLAIPEQIERILEEMPVEPCSAQLVTKSVYVGYKGRRAMVLDRRDDLLDLLLLDDGKYEANVPLSVCRRLPLMAHMTPRAAKIASLANCHVPADRPDLEASMMESVIGKKFDMNVIDDDSREVMLVDPQTRKYLNKELKSKYGL